MKFLLVFKRFGQMAQALLLEPELLVEVDCPEVEGGKL